MSVENNFTQLVDYNRWTVKNIWLCL